MGDKKMSKKPEYINKFLKFLKDANWCDSLLPTINQFINESQYTKIVIDNYVMNITKNVETTLRSSINQKQRTKVPNTICGTALIERALGCKLIEKKEDPLYGLLVYIIKEPRNTSHHEFKIYPFNSLVQFSLEANKAIIKINSRTKEEDEYFANFLVTYEHTSKNIVIDNLSIVRPDGSKLPTDQKVEIELKTQNDSFKTFPLEPKNGDFWNGRYDARGLNLGTVTVHAFGVDNGIDFHAVGGTVTVLSLSNTKCPFCGKIITHSTCICNSCGNQLSVI